MKWSHVSEFVTDINPYHHTVRGGTLRTDNHRLSLHDGGIVHVIMNYLGALNKKACSER